MFDFPDFAMLCIRKLNIVALMLLLSLLFGCKCFFAPSFDQNEIQIFAASSLKEALSELVLEFNRESPERHAKVQFAGSHVLRAQIAKGAQADLFIPADESEFEKLPKGLTPNVWSRVASNKLVLIIRKDSELNSNANLRELPKFDRIVIGSEHSPIGRYSREALLKARLEWGDPWYQAVKVRIVSNESNVRLVRAKVALGEADAALVYQSDVNGIDEVLVEEIPVRFQPEIHYAAAILPKATNSSLSGLFVRWMTSKQGQEIFEKHGFGPGALDRSAP